MRKKLSVWTPKSITLVQLDQEFYVLNLAAIERMRAIEEKTKHTKGMIPSRTAIQRYQKRLYERGSLITKPVINQYHDIVELNTRCVVEAIIDTTEWPGIPATSTPPNQVTSLLSALPPLMLDATADGAELTTNRGMIVQGLKIVTPTLLERLVPSSPARSARVEIVGVNDENNSNAANTTTTNNTISGENLNDAFMENVRQVDGHTNTHGGEHVNAEEHDTVDDAASDASDDSVTSTEFPFQEIRSEALESNEDTQLAHNIVAVHAQAGVVVENNVVPEDVHTFEGVQSSRTVVLTGFCHGSDNDIVDGEYNYNR